jgi:hypothetical protein
MTRDSDGISDKLEDMCSLRAQISDFLIDCDE